MPVPVLEKLNLASLMLAEAILNTVQFRIKLLHACTPLLHQLLSNPIRLLLAIREIHLIDHHLPQLSWQLCQRQLRLSRALPPILALWRDIRGRDNGDFGIDEEEGDDLAVAWLGRVNELERADVVLIEVGEEEGAAWSGENTANELDGAGTGGGMTRQDVHGKGTL